VFCRVETADGGAVGVPARRARRPSGIADVLRSGSSFERSAFVFAAFLDFAREQDQCVEQLFI
jgi:hypothetical protein